jgi:cytochrome c oxidase subunit IV
MATPTMSSPPRIHFAQLSLGLVVGGLVFYCATLASSAWFGAADGSERILAMLGILLITGASVFVGSRWPQAALVAGVLMLALVVLAMVVRVDNAWAEVSWTDWRTVLAHGGGGLVVPVVGTVLVCSAIVNWVPARRGR